MNPALTEPLAAATADTLRPALVEAVQRMSPHELQTLRNLILDSEIEHLVGEVERHADEDRASGKLEPVDIEAAIREHRARHPYGG